MTSTETGIIKTVAVIAFICGILLIGRAFAATIDASVTWDGKDVSGKAEQSLPVTISLIDADTQDVYATVQTSGGENIPFPMFGIVPPENEVLTVRVYAVAQDSASPPNRSAPSEIVTFDLTGADTLGPGQPVIRLEVRP